MNLMFTGTTIAVAALAAAGVASAQLAKQTEPAQTTASVWLDLIDAGDYTASWQQAAEYFQRAVPMQRWIGMAGAVREPLGRVESRLLKSTTATRQLPGAPDGDYVVLQWRTRFEHKADAVETVTMQRGSDASEWRVVGYFVK